MSLPFETEESARDFATQFDALGLTDDRGIPFVVAFPREKLDGLKMACRYCRAWHYHGVGCGHRGAHCPDHDERGWEIHSAYHATGYILVPAWDTITILAILDQSVPDPQPGLPVPFGYAITDDGRLAVDVEGQKAISRAVTLHREGKSLAEIATTLAAEDLPSPPSVCGGRRGWDAETVEEVLHGEGIVLPATTD